MPHHASPRKLVTQRRVVVSCAAAAAAVLAAAVTLLAAPAAKAPSRAYLVGSVLSRPLEEARAEGSADVSSPSLAGPLLPPLPEITSSRVAVAPALSISSVPPAPSPVENFDGGSLEEHEHLVVKPISVGSTIVGSDSIEEHDTSGDEPVHPRAEMPLWSTAADEELMYANKEIFGAPLVSGDPDLYAPLFQNVSMFKRSYELMERLLKVFIYHDGEKPIFHSPELKGIYASEGWFMKLMEGNQNFVVGDPNRAHLFYLPYSSHKLEKNLYVPGSDTFEPLSIFVKNYIDKISAKFPYWNRTKGADHFFVACHDWGPYTTKLHKELRKNTIKALCNADLSEGVFVRGRDVSLPETFLRSPRRPQRDIGGKPAAERSILAFFAGQMHGRVRPNLLRHWGGKDADMRIYSWMPPRIVRRMNYAEHMKSSKYCICPMGYEVNSPRIVEAIYYECVPVIIADNFVLPFDGVLDWSAFSVVVPEKDVPRLKQILLGIPESDYLIMQSNVRKVQKHFMWHAKPVKYDIFHMILHSIWFSRVKLVQTQ